MLRLSSALAGIVALLVASAVHAQAPPPAIATTSPLPSATRATAYATTLLATRGVQPYTWGFLAGVSGPLSLVDPSTVGLTLNPATGVLSGNVPAGISVGSSRQFGFFVTDANGQRCPLTPFTFTVNPEPAAINGSLPAGLRQSVSFEVALSATGGTAPFTWSLAAGSLPDGVRLHSRTGLLHGSPTERGVFRFTVQARDANNATVARAFDLSISHAPTPAGGSRR
jgi:hypothetical protein